MIPFVKTTLGKEEKEAIGKVIDSGWVVQGQVTEEFEQKFAEYVGAKYAVFVDSGTSALFLSLKDLSRRRLLMVKTIIPSITFVATAEAILHAGSEIEFGDIDTDYCLKNIANNSLPVHLTGNKAKYGAWIYDSAHRIEKGDVKGSGALWCYSFYATKNMTTIQGGMIALNNQESYEWLKKARDHGISKGTKERYKDGSWEYSIDFLGWREKSDDVSAAIGLEQLKKLPQMTERRNEIVKLYNRFLGLENTGNHLYPILVDKRAEFISFMRKVGVQCSVHFLPLHKMPAFEKYYNGDKLDYTNHVGDRLVSLPLYPTMTDDEVKYVAYKVIESKSQEIKDIYK